MNETSERFCMTTLRKKNGRSPKPLLSVIDLFCGAGGLTRGLLDVGLNVVAGVDIDTACKFPYEHNNEAVFLKEDVASVPGTKLASHYPKGGIRILVGCAPCQPFSKYTQGLDQTGDGKWNLLRSFSRLIEEVKPQIVSMENVPELQNHSIFEEFVDVLESLGYKVSHSVVFCPNYGVPQHRSRLVLFASKFGKVEMISPTHKPGDYATVKSAIGHLPSLRAGKSDPHDPLHRSSSLSSVNKERIRSSKPGGSWRDWKPSLVAKCHKKKKGKTYSSVYGRMEWDAPSPTITTQFFGFGNGRFGHPKQNRAISLREGAILQSFPESYIFAPEGGDYPMKTIGRLIGNAVPVKLGQVIGKSVLKHLETHHEQ